MPGSATGQAVGQCWEAFSRVRDEDGGLSARARPDGHFLGRVSVEARRYWRPASIYGQWRNVRAAIRPRFPGARHQANDLHVDGWRRAAFSAVLRFAIVGA